MSRRTVEFRLGGVGLPLWRWTASGRSEAANERVDPWWVAWRVGGSARTLERNLCTFPPHTHDPSVDRAPGSLLEDGECPCKKFGALHLKVSVAGFARFGDYVGQWEELSKMQSPGTNKMGTQAHIDRLMHRPHHLLTSLTSMTSLTSLISITSLISLLFSLRR